jgi:hypothetical protein
MTGEIAKTNRLLIDEMPGNSSVIRRIDISTPGVIDSSEFTIYIPSNRPALCEGFLHSIVPLSATILNGENYSSISKMWNHCIEHSPTEIVIIANDKARPSYKHVKNMVELLKFGYGVVALHCFGFFGFKKEVIRRVGFFDERYYGGGHEDVDFVRRLRDANISYYETIEVPYIKMDTSWKNRNTEHHVKKWGAISHREFEEKALDEEEYHYDIGPATGDRIFSWNVSILTYTHY